VGGFLMVPPPGVGGGYHQAPKSVNHFDKRKKNQSLSLSPGRGGAGSKPRYARGITLSTKNCIQCSNKRKKYYYYDLTSKRNKMQNTFFLSIKNIGTILKSLEK
jgi:hypothetical protein